MIISAQKPLEEIRSVVAPFRKIAIFGCGGCAAVCQTGGTKQVEELVSRLQGIEVLFTFQIEEPCDQRILKRELARVADRLEQVEAVLVLACGIGVQTVGTAIEKPCRGGLNTLFPGAVIHSTRFAELCNACGQCILNDTAAICPRSLCPKGIANGPCSEKTGEMCSVDPETTCVWMRIAEAKGKLTPTSNSPDFLPLDWAARSGPRSIPPQNGIRVTTKKGHGKDS